jgi:predicted ribosome quality control (RQC) complex YloA/Tae2 family protein
MGRDKFENEDLIKYGWPEDIWFHVDDLSSAHVYLRMKPGMGMDDVPEEAVLDCSALVKANSIAGCKVSS